MDFVAGPGTPSWGAVQQETSPPSLEHNTIELFYHTKYTPVGSDPPA